MSSCTRIALVAIGLIALSPRVGAQEFAFPRVAWELATWPPNSPNAAPQTQATSEEDWFYSVTHSMAGGTTFDGFVAVGYSHFPSLQTTECVLDCDDYRGCTHGTISKISPEGSVEWFGTNDREGALWRVIDLSDGGFLAVGHTNDRETLRYNPGLEGSPQQLDCWTGQGPRRRLAYAARFHHNGELDWEAAYGLMIDPNDHIPTGAGALQPRQDQLWSAVERPDGSIRLVGNAVDPSIGMNPRAFVVDVDEENGVVLDIQAYGAGVAQQPATWRRSELMGIARFGNDYIAVGTQYDGEYDDPDGYGGVWVIKLGSSLNPAPVASVMLTSSSDVQDTGYDAAFAGDGSAHVAAVIACGTFPNHFGYCFRDGAGGVGNAVVHRLSRTDLSTLGTTGDDLGEVLAFDLHVRLTAMSDGRVGLVSTKQLEEPTGQNDAPWWFTDAFMAILDSTATVELMTTHDARTSMPHVEDGPKHQECLYDIAEAEDGGLVVVGNNSSNWDDNYFVRFAVTGLPSLPAPTVSHSHLVYPTTLVSGGVMGVAGDLTVAATGRLWVDAGRTLAFEEDARLFARGEVVVEGATLTAQSHQVWTGMIAAGAAGVVQLNDGTVVEGATAGVTVYSPARVAISGATTRLQSNGIGLLVLSDGQGADHGAVVEDATITDNGHGVVTDFTCTWDSGPYPSCSGFTTSHSRLRLEDAVVSDNAGYGLFASASVAEAIATTFSGNGSGGISVSNGTIETFRFNTVTANGGGGTGHGVAVLAGGDFWLSPPNVRGNNDVVNNAAREVWVASGGESFFGDASVNGFNEVYDTGGGVLVEYPSGGKALDAAYQWWSASGGPNPATAFVGPVEYCPYLTCDPDVNPNCTPGCQSSFSLGTPETTGGSYSAGGTSGTAASTTEGSFNDRLGARIRRIRAELAADPSSSDAAAQARELGSLHRLDRADSTREAASTDAVLAGLRARLTEGQVPHPARTVAEAALEVEALSALTRRDYGRATSLIEQYALLVEGEQTARQLTLVRAYVLAREGYRSEASALVLGLVAGSAPDEARELANLAQMMGRTVNAGGPGFGAQGMAPAASSEAQISANALRVVPNPAVSRTSVEVYLETPTRARVAMHDVLGREVALLVDGELPAGRTSLDIDVGRLPAGTYLIRATLESLDGGAQALARRLAVVRP